MNHGTYYEPCRRDTVFSLAGVRLSTRWQHVTISTVSRWQVAQLFVFEPSERHGLNPNRWVHD